MATGARADEALGKRFRIADLVVDVGRVAVERAGERVALPGLSFDLLVALARAAPDVVSNDELMKRVWAGVIVSPETVSQRVKLLRDALGDDPREPRYVAGVRGRGYRLIPPVEPLADLAATAVAGPAPRAVPDEPGQRAPVSGVVPQASAAPASAPTPAAAAARPRWQYAAAALAALALAAGAWLLRPDAGPAPGTAATPAHTAPTSVQVVGTPARTVAVLPFDNLGGEAADNFVGLGVAEMVLNRLAGSDQLFVVARSSSFAFEGRNVDAREIGRTLGARFLVQGSVQRAADLLRVTVQLVDAESGKQLRALTFDRPLRELFAVQDEIATQVATALDVTVGAVASGTTSVDAHLEYLRGLEAFGRYRVPEAKKAIAHFQRSQQLDPRYGAPYAAEARARAQVVQLTGGEIAPLRPELRRLAERAVELSPGLGMGYVARGALQDSPAAAERDLRRGIALAPNFSDGYLELAEALQSQPGRERESRELLERAILVDPLAPRPQYVMAMVRYDADGDIDALVERLDEVLRLDPSYTQALTRLASTFALRDLRIADAIAVVERSMAADPQSYVARERAMELYLRLGEFGAVDELTVSLPENSTARIALTFARGDARTAARLARRPLAVAAPGAPAGRPPDSRTGVLGIAVIAALLDEALTTGDYDGVRDFLLEHHCDAEPQPSRVACLSPSTFPAAFALIRIDAAAGRRERAERSARAALEWIDRGPFARAPPSFRSFLVARAQLAGGSADAALRALQENGPNDVLPIPLWLLEGDRMFDPLRGTPGFEAIVASLRERMGREQARLETLRAAGTVPRRPTKATVATGR